MKSILLGVTLRTRKSFMTLILLCVLSVGDAQSSCNKHCNLGSPVSDEDGNCICKCVLRYTGERCDILPNCGSKSCVNHQGNLRGDCTCDCVASYAGERCQTFRCPYRDHPVCGLPNYNDCTSPIILGECPYLCNRCSESQKPKFENSKYLHISQYDCVFQGLRPSKEMCKTLGNNGDDKTSCFDESDVDTNCRRCNNGGRHALVNCPVMCALCDKPEVTATVQNTEMTSLTRNITHVPQTTRTQKNSQTRNITHVPQTTRTQKTSQTLGSCEIAAVVLGVVLCGVIVAFIVVVVVLTKRYSSRKHEGNFAVQSGGEVCERCYENSNAVNRNEHYVTVNNVEDETNSKYEMLSIDSSADRSNDRGHEYDDATPGP